MFFSLLMAEWALCWSGLGGECFLQKDSMVGGYRLGLSGGGLGSLLKSLVSGRFWMSQCYLSGPSIP